MCVQLSQGGVLLAPVGGIELGVFFVEAPGVHGAEFINPSPFSLVSDVDAAFGEGWCADKLDHTDGAVFKVVMARRCEMV